MLIETFVETPRYTGAVYRASGWTYVGTTQGRGRYDRDKLYDKPRKDVWLRPLTEGLATHPQPLESAGSDGSARLAGMVTYDRKRSDKPCRRDGSEKLIVRKRAEIGRLDAQNGRQAARLHGLTDLTERIRTIVSVPRGRADPDNHRR